MLKLLFLLPTCQMAYISQSLFSYSIFCLLGVFSLKNVTRFGLACTKVE